MKKINFIVIMLAFIELSVKAQIPQFWGMTNGYSYDFSSTIYKVNADGTGYQQVVINYPDWDVYGKLLKAPDGNLYGLSLGLQGSGGTLFKIDPATFVFTEITYLPSINLDYPYGNLTLANNGKLYGTTSWGDPSPSQGGAIFSYDINTNQTSVVYNFDTTGLTGGASTASLLLANNSLLYGINNNGLNGYGVIFSFDPNTNIYSDLYDMDSINGGNNSYEVISFNNLIQANNGLLYGMTDQGGTSNQGVIFSFDLSTNTYTKLVDFTGSNGANPLGTPLQANNGLLYGMTSKGGTENAGVIYSYDINSNTYSVLFNFDTLTFNINPRGSLIQASDGKLYGTTGRIDQLDTFGNSIFQFDPVSNIYSVIYTFNVDYTGNGPGDLTEASPNGGCSAYFTLYPDTTQQNHYIAVNMSSGIPPLHYYWSWGDSTYDTIQTPSHIYADTGMYTICLTIMDSTGCSSTYCDSSYDIQRTSNLMAYVNVVLTGKNSYSPPPFAVKVFPNPNNGKFSLSYHTQSKSDFIIKDVTGRIVFRKNIQGSDSIEISNICNGIYFWQLASNSEIFSTGKIAIIK